jgi:hypothetical protein
VEQDRQVAGHWTGYSSPLERVVLKKLRYLAEGGPEPAANGDSPGASESQPAKPNPTAQPSLFGEKLGRALEEPHEAK